MRFEELLLKLNLKTYTVYTHFNWRTDKRHAHKYPDTVPLDVSLFENLIYHLSGPRFPNLKYTWAGNLFIALLLGGGQVGSP
jgi:hypothetical protein